MDYNEGLPVKNDEIFTQHRGCPETSGQLEWKFLKDEILNLNRIYN
jgi:hypothetical protein